MITKSKQHTYSLFLLLTAIFSSCISDFDYETVSQEPVPVVNSILFADSILQTDISWSGDPNANHFEPVSGADVKAFANGVPLIPANYGNNGIYRFDHIIKAGNNYSISIEIPGENNISASTRIPPSPIITCNKTGYESYNTLYTLSIESVNSDINALYIFIFYKDQSGEWTQSFLYCNSPFADVFNRYFAPEAPTGFSFLYDYFVRVPVNNIVDKKSTIELIPFGGGNTAHYKLYVISATKEYDYYFKAAYIQQSFDPEIDTPFGFNTIQLPGNISGSPGVFCGASIVMFDFAAKQP